LKDVLIKYGIEDKIAHCMKTTISVYKEHYINICKSFDDIEVVGSDDYNVIDLFYTEYEKTKDADLFGTNVASYIKGWWGDVLEGGLAQ
jgi:hypothetical protein